jgi:hypothetical protein
LKEKLSREVAGLEAKTMTSNLPLAGLEAKTMTSNLPLAPMIKA